MPIRSQQRAVIPDRPAALMLALALLSCLSGAAADCRDRVKSCATFAGPQYGFCDGASNQSDYMSAHCAATCGRCQTSSPGDGLAAPPLPSHLCVDAVEPEHCAAWSTEGYCGSTSHFRAYMALNCNATCGLCSLDGVVAQASAGTGTEDADSTGPSRYVIIVPIAMAVLLIIGWAAGVAYMRRHRTTDEGGPASAAGLPGRGDEEHSVYEAPRSYYTKTSASTMSAAERTGVAPGQSQRMTFSEVASVAGAVLKAQSQISGSPTPSDSTQVTQWQQSPAPAAVGGHMTPESWATFMASSNMAAITPTGATPVMDEYLNLGSPLPGPGRNWGPVSPPPKPPPRLSQR